MWVTFPVLVELGQGRSISSRYRYPNRHRAAKLTNHTTAIYSSDREGIMVKCRERGNEDEGIRLWLTVTMVKY